MKKLKRFFNYYRPHRKLFLFDLICSFAISVCNMFYPMIARTIMNDYVPNENLRMLITWAIVLACIYALKCALTFIVGYWGHVLGIPKLLEKNPRKSSFERCSFSIERSRKSLYSSTISRILE